MDLTSLPTLNALLNSASAVFLLSGYCAVRRKRIQVHKFCMLAALSTSVLFLVSYLIYHYNVGSRSYEGLGTIRLFYFAILLSHTVLAAANLPLVGLTLVRALKGDFGRHRVIARWTLPIWIYVSVTGVVIYIMLYGV